MSFRWAQFFLHTFFWGCFECRRYFYHLLVLLLISMRIYEIDEMKVYIIAIYFHPHRKRGKKRDFFINNLRNAISCYRIFFLLLLASKQTSLASISGGKQCNAEWEVLYRLQDKHRTNNSGFFFNSFLPSHIIDAEKRLSTHSL